MASDVLYYTSRPMKKKIIVGWFSFSCCEDSTIIFTELLNDYYEQWMKVMDIRYAKILRKDKPIGPMDIAFVEGAITSPEQEVQLKKIRENSKKLVAIGSCACTGMPSGHRNTFDEQTQQEIQNIIKQFKYTSRVSKLEELVTVDAKVPGCPMDPQKFSDTLNKLTKELSIA